MKQMVQLTATLIIAVLALASLATADVPQMINYQGHLTDAGGAPLDTTVAMAFTIYDDSTGGTDWWTESHPTVNVDSGAFSVILGTVTPIDDSVFSEPNRWLGIKVGMDPELVPRTRLVTAPYAYRVATVDSASGGTIAGNLKVTGHLEVGTHQITIRDMVTHDEIISDLGKIAIGKDVAGVFDPDIQVGIGTTNPVATLHVNGSVYTLGGSGDANLSGAVNVGDATYISSYLNQFSFLSEGEFAEADVDGDGRVTGDDLIILVRFLKGIDGLYEGRRWVQSAYGMRPGSPYTGDEDYFYVRDRAGIGISAYGILTVSRDGLTCDMIVDSSTGNVGIGTTNPVATLHVNGSVFTLGGSGDANLSGSVNISDITYIASYLHEVSFLSEGEFAEADVDGDGRVTGDDLIILVRYFQGIDGKYQARRYVQSAYGMRPGNAFSPDYFYVRDRAGIGTEFPVGILVVSHDGLSYDLVVDSLTGNVGIGTASPQGALDVSSTTGAFIVPRMTTTERDALTAVNGMIIYNTTDNQFNFYENGAWVTK
jgi:hypothetical protein